MKKNMSKSFTKNSILFAFIYVSFNIIAAPELFTYDNGPWNSPATWTEDPSGTSPINQRIPTASDKITILNARTVSLTDNVTTLGLNVVINLGGTIDMKTFSFSTISGLSGQGVLRLNSPSFPIISGLSPFLNAGQGTVEYYNLSTTLPTTVTTYNNLWLTKDDATLGNYVFTLGSNLNLNGDLRIRNTSNIGISTLAIGNSTTARNLTILGSFINGDSFGSSASTVVSVSGFNATHTANIYGDLKNYGTIDFSNDAQYATPTQCMKLVFLGSTDNQFFCDGPTEIFDLATQKGSDQSYNLHLSATSASHFKANSNVNIFYTNNVNSKGTLRLGNNINLTRLHNGGNLDLGSNSNVDFGLWIDGANITLATISTRTADAVVIYSKLRISAGSLTVGQQGVVPRQDGELKIEGGVLNTTKYRTSTTYTQTPRGSFNMSGGVLNINPDIIDGSSANAFAMFVMPYDEQVFIMSGGIVNIFTQERTGVGINGGIHIAAKNGNYNVTGGTFNVTVVGAGGIFNINSTAPFYDLNIFTTVANTSLGVALATQARPGDVLLPNPFPSLPLTILNNLYINGTIPAKLSLGTQTLNLKKNIELATNARLDATSGTINFNGNTQQTALFNGSIIGVINNLSNTNASSNTVLLQGSIATLTVNSLNLTSGTLNDGGKTIKVIGNTVINGTHTGNGLVELAGASTQTINTSGNGTFSNLMLSNTNGAVGSEPISLLGDIRITNSLILNTDRVFNINTNGITMLSNSILSTTGNTFSANKFIRMSGNQSDPGLSRFTFNNATPLFYPIGTGSSYTPLTATLSGISNANNQGFLQISVNNNILATLSLTGVPNSALLYNWRVKGNGFVSPPSVSYIFNSSVAGVWPTGVIGAGNFVGGRVVVPNRIPETTTVTANGLISIAPHTIPSDANYTAAQLSRFNGAVRVFYNLSITGGMKEVFTDNIFSTLCHTCVGTTQDPGLGDVIRLTSFTDTNDDHWVSIGRNLSVAGVIFENRNLGGWGPRLTLDPDWNVNLGNVSGNGTVMVRSDGSPAQINPIFGDFGDFASVLTSDFNYQFTSGSGNVTLPISPTVYPTLRLETQSDTRFFTFPNLPLQINNSLVIGDGAVAYTSTANGANITIDNNLRIGLTNGQIGKLILNDVGFAKTIFIGGNINISNSHASNEISVLNTNPNGLIHTIKVRGNISKQLGILDLDNGTATNANQAQLEFVGETNGIVNNIGGSTMEFYKLIINKGTSQSPTVTFLTGFNTSNLSSNSNKFITFQNGTLILSSSGINISLSSGGGLVSIPSTSGLQVVNGAIVNMSSTTGILLDGTLRIGNNGTANFNDGINNTYIEYSSSNNARLEILGNANFNLGGQIRRSTSSNAGTLHYVQTGGNVTVSGLAAVTTNAKFELDNAGSSISMTGGNFYIQRGGGSVTFGDLYLDPGTANITGGTFVLSPLTAIGNQSYRIITNPNLNNLHILPGGTSSATGTLLVYPLRVNNDLVVGSNATLNANSFGIESKGNTTFLGAYITGANTTSFTGNGLQNLVLNRPILFNNFLVNKSNALSLSGINTTVNGLLSLVNGTLNDGGLSVFANSNIVNSAVHTGIGKLVLSGTLSKRIYGNGLGSFGNVEVLTSTEPIFDNEMTINGSLNVLNNGIYIDDNLLNLGINASVLGATSTKFIRTNGVVSDDGVVKFMPASTFDFTFPIGYFGKYTPARYTATSNTASGAIRVIPVNTKHPLTSTEPLELQLKYYWIATSTGFSGLAVNHAYTYQDSDVIGTESLYKAGRSIQGDWAPHYGGFASSIGGLNTTSNLITINGVSFINGEYTAGETSEFQTVLTYYSRDATMGGNWDDLNTWSTDPILRHTGPAVAFFPNGQPIVVKLGHTVLTNSDLRQAYSTSVSGTIDLFTTSGHNFGLVSGAGTIRISVTPSLLFKLPAGQLTAFVNTLTGGTFEFYGSNNGDLPAMNPPDLPRFNNVLISGTSTKTISSSSPTYNIGGNLSITGGVLANASDNNIVVSKNWINTVGLSGFNAGTLASSYVELNGVNQIVTGQTQFRGLRITGGGIKTFNSNTNVTGELQLTNGIVDMGSSNILSILTSEGSVSGGSTNSFVKGFLQKSFNTGGSVTQNFQVGDGVYSPVTITFPSVSTQGNLTVKAVDGTHPLLSSSCLSSTKRVNRFWTITSTSPFILPTNYNVTPTFCLLIYWEVLILRSLSLHF